jgi:hypothetical protein
MGASRKRAWSEEHNQLLQSYYEQQTEVDVAELAATLNYTEGTVKGYIRSFCKANNLIPRGIQTGKFVMEERPLSSLEKAITKELLKESVYQHIDVKAKGRSNKMHCKCRLPDDVVWITVSSRSKEDAEQKAFDLSSQVTEVLEILTASEFQDRNLSLRR